MAARRKPFLTASGTGGKPAGAAVPRGTQLPGQWVTQGDREGEKARSARPSGLPAPRPGAWLARDLHRHTTASPSSPPAAVQGDGEASAGGCAGVLLGRREPSAGVVGTDLVMPLPGQTLAEGSALRHPSTGGRCPPSSTV